jgi:hypothetical protein
MALIAYLTYKLLLKATKNSLLSQIISGIIGAIIMAFGYFFYEIIFFCSAGVAIINVPYNLIQGAVGVALSTAIMQILHATNILEKFKQKGD